MSGFRKVMVGGDRVLVTGGRFYWKPLVMG
jgi:hypothetical protein